MKILRILRVHDTREYEEGPDGKWRPIPGSGVEHECARCGRLHEVHAEVETEGGGFSIVGTGCMGAVDLDVAARKLAGKASTRRKHECALRRLRADIEAIERLRTTTIAPAPRFWTETIQTVISRDGAVLALFAQCDDTQPIACRWLTYGCTDTPELRTDLAILAREDWTRATLVRAGLPTTPLFALRDQAKWYEKRLSAGGNTGR